MYRKKQKRIDKALVKVLSELEILELKGRRHGFVITCLREDDDSVSALSMLIDPKTDHENGAYAAADTGGHIGIALRTAHEVCSESIQSIVEKTTFMAEIANMINRIGDNDGS